MSVDTLGQVLWSRPGAFTWRMLATVLGGQGLTIMLGAVVARSLAVVDGSGRASIVLFSGLAVGVLAFLAAGAMRTAYGLPLGWVVQLLTWLSAFVMPAMMGVGLIFTGLWVMSLVKGRAVDAMMADPARTDTATGQDESHR